MVACPTKISPARCIGTCKITIRADASASPSIGLSDIQHIEINAAFAASVFALTRDLCLPKDTVNVEGGGVTHGHPIGATGAILTTRLIHSMRHNGLKRGVVTLCIGGSQGIALALEMVE